ncbi:hypothetical protein [Chryseobacterium aureum]|uniref:hypothetical protein n=1 Tax=Chryseobacterium aureum TaxID=2497456 RepID=UPI000F893781|nr:hypothetical protein [Chryseobacterium aureum]
MMKKHLITLLTLTGIATFGQVGINTPNPNLKAGLHISERINENSATPDNFNGLLIQRYTTSERNNINPGEKENGLTIYNKETNCYNVWNWNGSASAGDWAQFCGEKPSTVIFSDCSTIKVIGTYNIDEPVTNQNVHIDIPVRVTGLGSYNYSTTVNGVTFVAQGTFTSIGQQTISMYPTSAAGTPSTGTYNTTISSIGSSKVNCNVPVNFISRTTSVLKIINISGTNYSTGLITGCGSYSSSNAAGKIGTWLTSGQAQSIAGVAGIQIKCVDPTNIADLSDELKTASIVYLNGRTSTESNSGTIAVLNDWYKAGKGIVIDQGDELPETQFAQGLGFYIESGTTSTISITASALPQVLISPEGYTLPAVTPTTIATQGANAAFVTSTNGIVFGSNSSSGVIRRYLYADITSNQGIGNDKGAFIFGDKSGANTDTNTFDLWKNIFAWAIHNAPIH